MVFGRREHLRVLLRPDHLSPAEYVRLLHLALERVTPPASDESAAATRLRASLATIAARITESSSKAELEAAISAAADLIRQHYGTEAHGALQQMADLKAVMRAMTDTVTFLSESRSTVVHQLTFLERQLEEATELDDIRLLRPRLIECLDLVRKETARLQDEALAHTQNVKTKMGMPSPVPPPRRLGGLDLATGLPRQGAAEKLILDKIATGLSCSLGLFVPERLAFLAKRHGDGTEDAVLLNLAQHLVKQIPKGTWLYRWTGPAILAVHVPCHDEEYTAQLWNQIASRAIEGTIANERRSALVKISVVCLTRTLRPGSAVQPVLDEMDSFVGAAARE